MTVTSPPKDDSGDLRERLADIPRQRLVEEVVSRWDDVIRLEGEMASLRRRVRESELVAQSGGSDELVVGELEERIRVAASKIRQLESLLQNESSRRESAEANTSRLEGLQEENARLLRNEEELLLLGLDMEAQIDRLSGK